ncbi:uncharacterized protein [Antedon mediterranea]|uniref:uncharacterized protein n=1 Tax=Antedon mediterranea TaxID=105859 RepID=UPI003AF9F6D6
MERNKLEEALHRNDLQTIKHICRTQPDLVTSINEDGDTPLHEYLRTVNPTLDIVTCLIQNDTSAATLQNKDGDTPLHEYLSKVNPTLDIVTCLVQNDTSAATLKNKDGNTSVNVLESNMQMVYQERNKILKLFDKLLIPAEIYAKGADAIKIYKDELENGEITVVNARCMFLGKEGAGKTSCVKRMLGERFNSREPSTDGIVTATVFQVTKEDSSNWKKIKDIDDVELTKQIRAHALAENVDKKLKKESNDTTLQAKLKHFVSQNVGTRKVNVSDITSIWDFAGQLDYYITHRFFLTNKVSYCVTFNVMDNLNELANPRGFSFDSLGMTNLDMNLFWIRSIYEHTVSQHGSGNPILIDGKIIESPPICLVATHMDKLSGTESEKQMKAEKMFMQMFDAMKGLPYANHVDREMYMVDNTVKSHEGIEKLKRNVGRYMKAMVQEVPVKWVNLQEKLQIIGKTRLYITLTEVSEIATQCGIPQNVLATAISYLNVTGIIMYTGTNEKLRNIVITNLHWMIEVLTKVITVVTPMFEMKKAEDRKQLQKLWEKLSNEGVLEETLLRYLWRNEDEDLFEIFVELMKVFRLLFEKTKGIKEGNRIFLVPCRMKVDKKDILKVTADDKQTVSIYLTPTDFLPDAVYNTLVVAFLELMTEKGIDDSEVFRNRSDFRFSGHTISLGSVKINHEREKPYALKLEISRWTDIKQTITTVDDGKEGEVLFELQPSVCMEVLSYLKEQLETVCNIYEGIGYTLRVLCTACKPYEHHLIDLEKCLNSDSVPCGRRNAMDTARIKHLLSTNENIPSAITAHGADVQEVYAKALTEGSVKINLGMLKVMGQEGVGKTCLINACLGKEFNRKHDVTDGIAVIRTVTTTWTEDYDDSGDPSKQFTKYVADKMRTMKTENVVQKSPKDDDEFENIEGHDDDINDNHTNREDNHSKNDGHDNHSKDDDHDNHSKDDDHDNHSKDDDHDNHSKDDDHGNHSKDDDHGNHSKDDDHGNHSKDDDHGNHSKDDDHGNHSKQSSDNDHDKQSSHGTDIPFDTDQQLDKNVIKEVEENKEDPLEETFNIWDHGGQLIYHGIHRMFMTVEALYIIVFNLSVNLEDRAIFIDANGKKRKHHWTNLQFILSYIQSVYSHSRIGKENKEKGVHKPTILIVGTHKGKLSWFKKKQNAEAKKVFKKLRTALKEKLYEEHVYHRYFAIENSKETTDESFSELKKVIDEFMSDLEKPVPLKWMRFRCGIHNLRREKHFSLCPVEELKTLASENGIADEKQQSILLNFLYDLGEIVYMPDNKLLKDKAVLDPMQLVEIVTAFVTVIPPEDPLPIFRKAFDKLDKGILEEDLLRELWKKRKVDEGKNFEFLVALMIKLGFICERKTTNSQDRASTSIESVGKRSFFVPLRLAFKTSSEVKPVPDDSQSISIYYDFKGYLPDVLFPYMIIDFLNKFQMKGVDPILLYNHAELDFNQDHHVNLSLVKFVTMDDERKFLLKVTIKRTPASNETSNDEPSSEACKEVLLTIQKSFEPSQDGGRRGIQYERCILCDVCSDTSEQKHIQNLGDFHDEKLKCSKTGTYMSMDVTRYKRLFEVNTDVAGTSSSNQGNSVIINLLPSPEGSSSSSEQHHRRLTKKDIFKECIILAICLLLVIVMVILINEYKEIADAVSSIVLAVTVVGYGLYVCRKIYSYHRRER